MSASPTQEEVELALKAEIESNDMAMDISMTPLHDKKVASKDVAVADCRKALLLEEMATTPAKKPEMTQSDKSSTGGTQETDQDWGQSWRSADWSEDQWWGSQQWLPRSWSSSSQWERDWAVDPGMSWMNRRGWSRFMEAETHPGWGGEGVSEAQQIRGALTRAATDLLEQSRPTKQMQEKAKQDEEAARVQDAKPASEASARGGEPESKNPASATEVPEEHKDPAGSQDAQDSGPEAETFARPGEHESKNLTSAAEVLEEHKGPSTNQVLSSESSGTKAAPARPLTAKEIKESLAQDPESWRKDRRGNWLSPHALYMRFYRNVRSFSVSFILMFLIAGSTQYCAVMRR